LVANSEIARKVVSIGMSSMNLAPRRSQVDDIDDAHY